MFSAVKSCSRKTLIATSVPFHMPRKTSPKKPEKEKYIDGQATVNYHIPTSSLKNKPLNYQ
jgi:hypothetical protein